MFLEAWDGGVARQLADKYQGLEQTYSDYCKKHNNRFIDLSGDVFLYETPKKIIANMFSQNENFDTNYLNMEIALKEIKRIAEREKLSIAIPYGIGCGIASGDWKTVYKIIEEVFSNYDVILYKLER